MPYFYFVIFAMVSCFKNPYRGTALVLLVACSINILLLATNFYGTMSELHDYSGIILGTLIDIVTLYAMLKYGGRFKVSQAIVLLLFLALNTIMILPIGIKPSYDVYMSIALSLNILHIVLLYGGIIGFLHKCRDALRRNSPMGNVNASNSRDNRCNDILDNPMVYKKTESKK